MRIIAEHGNGSPISVRVISELDSVPYQFARRISYDLTNAGLIKVLRGARGGALLALPPEKISLYDIVKVGQGYPICSRCSLDEDWCEHEKDCKVRLAWEELDKMVSDYLHKVKLSDLIRPVEERPVSKK